jgi:hypothetical protein
MKKKKLGQAMALPRLPLIAQHIHIINIFVLVGKTFQGLDLNMKFFTIKMCKLI